MHCEPRQQVQCKRDGCTVLFTPRKGWQAFCGVRCRNEHHAAERRSEGIKAAAPELFEALLIARDVLKKNGDQWHIWLNAPTKPEVCLGDIIEQALRKAGHKEKPAP